jgi:hypothetical protein
MRTPYEHPLGEEDARGSTCRHHEIERGGENVNLSDRLSDRRLRGQVHPTRTRPENLRSPQPTRPYSAVWAA